jgi:hypothetical protein
MFMCILASSYKQKQNIALVEGMYVSVLQHPSCPPPQIILHVAVVVSAYCYSVKFSIVVQT